MGWVSSFLLPGPMQGPKKTPAIRPIIDVSTVDQHFFPSPEDDDDTAEEAGIAHPLGTESGRIRVRRNATQPP